MVKVSIVVPVYNTSKYLNECIDSLLNQSFNDLEIICINDGSTDNSLDILKKYENTYSNIRVYSQKNSGLSITRNNGIKYSNGDYIYFMDSDDFLEPNTIEELYNHAEGNDLDVIIFKLINLRDCTYEKYTESYYEMKFLKKWDKKIFSLNDLGSEVLDIAVSAPGKFFKKDLIKDMKFPENLIFEDNLFFAEVMIKAERVSFLDKHLYNRRRRENSITQVKNLKFADSIIIINRIIDLAKQYGLYDKYKFDLWERKILKVFNRFSAVDLEYKEDFFKLLKEDFADFEQEVIDEKILQNINQTAKYCYETALTNEDYDIFELKVRYFEIKQKNKQLKKKNKQLDKDIKYYSKENKLMLSSTSWKVTKPLRVMGKLFK